MMNDKFGVYLKGGVTEVTITPTETDASTFTDSTYTAKDLYGVMTGVGAKFYVGNFFAKAEYVETDFAKYSHTSTTGENNTITEIFSSTGIVMWLEKESQINDIIAVTGSSPAYFFLFMEAIESKAKALGFSPEQARLLVQQTACGAAQMVESQTIEISELRQNVTSKGGTTAQAIAHFQQHNLTQTVADAMDACIARAEQMETEL